MIEGTIISARPLQESSIRETEQRFSALLGDEVRLRPTIDEALLGGISVEVAGRVYDGSLRLQLRNILAVLQTRGEE